MSYDDGHWETLFIQFFSSFGDEKKINKTFNDNELLFRKDYKIRMWVRPEDFSPFLEFDSV
jgi:hypothetical protein